MADIFQSPSGNEVRLTNERHNHIIKRHPEVEEYLSHFESVFSDPDFYVVCDDESFVARKVNHLYLVVYFKESGDLEQSFVLTAHLTSKIQKVAK